MNKRFYVLYELEKEICLIIIYLFLELFMNFLFVNLTFIVFWILKKSTNLKFSYENYSEFHKLKFNFLAQLIDFLFY